MDPTSAWDSKWALVSGVRSVKGNTSTRQNKWLKDYVHLSGVQNWCGGNRYGHGILFRKTASEPMKNYSRFVGWVCHEVPLGSKNRIWWRPPRSKRTVCVAQGTNPTCPACPSLDLDQVLEKWAFLGFVPSNGFHGLLFERKMGHVWS